jgi:hypothetical protein
MKKIAFIFLVVILGSCSKNEVTSDCELKNYGILKVNFAAANIKHGILVTFPGTGRGRDKIVEIGKSSDTLHLFPGSYSVNIASLNDRNQAIDDETKTVSIKTCTDTEINVNF